jgi:hypothetical protein
LLRWRRGTVSLSESEDRWNAVLLPGESIQDKQLVEPTSVAKPKKAKKKSRKRKEPIGVRAPKYYPRAGRAFSPEMANPSIDDIKAYCAMNGGPKSTKWTTANKREVMVCDMDDSHLRNCIFYIKRNTREKLQTVGNEYQWKEYIRSAFWAMILEAYNRGWNYKEFLK